MADTFLRLQLHALTEVKDPLSPAWWVVKRRAKRFEHLDEDDR